MSFRPRERLRRLLIGVTLLFLSLGLITVSSTLARQADAERGPERATLIGWLGTADLVLSSSSRWLRHPSQSEPGAASADVPAGLDVDPAGASIGPPREVLSASARDMERRP